MTDPQTPTATDDDQVEVVLTMTLGQARALSKSADLYVRLCIGKLEQVGELVREEVLPCHTDGSEARLPASVPLCDAVERLMREAKVLLGYPINGGPGIGHPHVHVSAHRAWEVCKVLNKALADHRDPSPAFRGPHHYGLGAMRYTTDKAPDAVVRSVQASPASTGARVPPQ